MKQIISVADLATILNVINEEITNKERWSNSVLAFDQQERAREIKARKEELKKDPFYKSVLHAKKALEECNIEIEVPDLEVQK